MIFHNCTYSKLQMSSHLDHHHQHRHHHCDNNDKKFDVNMLIVTRESLVQSLTALIGLPGTYFVANV
jgi:hypothetical protein